MASRRQIFAGPTALARAHRDFALCERAVLYMAGYNESLVTDF